MDNNIIKRVREFFNHIGTTISSFGERIRKKTAVPSGKLDQLKRDIYKPKVGPSKFEGLRFDPENKNQTVKEVQNILKNWVPSWSDWLIADEKYGNNTEIALTFLKTIFGISGDAKTIDSKTAEILEKLEKFQNDPKNNPDPVSELPDSQKKWSQKLLMLGRKYSYPFKSASFTEEEIKETFAKEGPFEIILYKNNWMQALTALNFIELENKITDKYPDYKAQIFGTNVRRPDKSRMDVSHNEGKLIKLILYNQKTGKKLNSSELEPLKPLFKEYQKYGFEII